MKFLVMWEANSHDTKEEVDVICEDGGVATIRHNGEHIVTDYYQSRIKQLWVTTQESIWDKLAEGKMYCKDWKGDQEPTEAHVLDAIDWLYMSDVVGDIDHPYEMYCYQPNEDTNLIIKEFVFEKKSPNNLIKKTFEK